MKMPAKRRERKAGVGCEKLPDEPPAIVARGRYPAITLVNKRKIISVSHASTFGIVEAERSMAGVAKGIAAEKNEINAKHIPIFGCICSHLAHMGRRGYFAELKFFSAVQAFHCPNMFNSLLWKSHGKVVPTAWTFRPVKAIAVLRKYVHSAFPFAPGGDEATFRHLP